MGPALGDYEAAKLWFTDLVRGVQPRLGGVRQRNRCQRQSQAAKWCSCRRLGHSLSDGHETAQRL